MLQPPSGDDGVDGDGDDGDDGNAGGDHADGQAACYFNYSAILHKYFSLFFCPRNVLGTKTLGDILSDRESIALEMQTVLDEGTEPWGVKVERVEVKF